ncbi:MAG: hypothetical protein KDJ50_07900 [Alphaproteobacteria bacterium]|nr:hypothetical protein [Alphaproteobacteria bacterium]
MNNAPLSKLFANLTPYILSATLLASCATTPSPTRPKVSYEINGKTITLYNVPNLKTPHNTTCEAAKAFKSIALDQPKILATITEGQISTFKNTGLTRAEAEQATKDYFAAIKSAANECQKPKP